MKIPGFLYKLMNKSYDGSHDTKPTVHEAAAASELGILYSSVSGMGMLMDTLYSMGNGLITTDRSYNVTLMNPAAEEITGYSRNEAIGKPVTDIFRTIDEKSFQDTDNILESIAPGVKNKQSILVTRQGELCTVSSSIREIKTDSNESAGIVIVFEDITEKNQQEKVLKESEIKYRNLYQYAENAVFLIDGHQFIDCNSKAISLFVCERDKLISTSIFDLLVPDENGSTINDIQEKLDAAKLGTPQFFQSRLKRPDNSVFDSEISLRQIDLGGRTILQATVCDTSLLASEEEKIYGRSNYDILTALPNRKFFYEHVKRAIDNQDSGSK
ncbi:MAG: PAS domain S-box protein, partial [Pseudomonadota bacterium]